MTRKTGYLVSLATSALIWLAAYLIITNTPLLMLLVRVPALTASIFLGTLLVDLFGHMIAYRLYGIETKLTFFMLGEAIHPIEKHEYRKKRENWAHLARIQLSGAMANLLFIFIALIFSVAKILDYHHFVQIVLINCLFMISSLIPLWELDGGRFAKLLFDSTPKRHDMGRALMMISCLSFLFLVAYLQLYPVFLYVLLIYITGLLYAAVSSKRRASKSPRAISKKERHQLTAFYLTLVIIPIILLLVIRFKHLPY